VNNLVRHELGHARGLLHEHQRSECKGWFDFNAIEADTHWSPETTEQNVGAFIDLPDSGFTPKTVGPYDSLSIMQYNFPIKWWAKRPGETNPCLRTELVEDPSAGDRATLIAMYGATPAVRIAGSAEPKRTFDQRLTNLQKSLVFDRSLAEANSEHSAGVDSTQSSVDMAVSDDGLGAGRTKASPKLAAAIASLESSAAELSLLRKGQLRNAVTVNSPR
jgi:hypothetical protein